ncbi:MAG: hypothetical protein QNJ77_14290 [Acidimicrobiia bacterium]|nr:hypothetical protein [Acidimicrobiia bacterium]
MADTLSSRLARRLWRAGALAIITAGVTLALATPVAAHDPIFLTDEQMTPDTGPYLPDGAISWAIYGTFPAAGETRGFEFDLRDGDDLYASLLIPNLEPEISLPDTELPYAELTLPNGEILILEAEIREVFDEQFSGTSYITLVELKEPAIAGRHTIVVHSRGPARFVVPVGEREEFFTPAERTVDRPTSFMGIADPLNAWYQTPPGANGAETPTEASIDEVEIDVEGMETELEALAEEAATTTAVQQAAPVPAASDDDDSGLTWVLPVAIVVAVASAGGIWLARRRTTAA